MKLQGKAFVITGGLGVLGSATAALIVEKGGYAVLLDIVPQDKAEAKLAERNATHPGKYVYQQADISDKTLMAAAVEAALKALPKGSLFGAVHCAAVNPQIPWTNKMCDKIDDFEKCLKYNAYGTFVVDAVVADAINAQYEPLDAFAPRVTEERGCIVNIASVVAYHTPARCLTYGPSKTCVLGITDAAADFLAPTGIRVNSIAPAIILSPLMDAGGRAKFFTEELESQSMFPRRFTEPAEVAEAIVFLLENSMMNAFHLKVDAGWRMISDWTNQDPRLRCPVIE